jgi:hypothetical protein
MKRLSKRRNVPEINNGNMKGLIEFLNSLVDKGRARKSTVLPLRIAVTKIFETVEGEGWENVNVMNVDLDDYMSRFKNKALDNYTSKSYHAYRSRAARAIRWYKNFLKDPGWAPKINTHKADGATKTARVNKLIDSQAIKQDLESGPSVSKMIAFPFPLSNGELATLHLPAMLTQDDARRVSSFISALVIDTREGG